jgi:hypothetical protein
MMIHVPTCDEALRLWSFPWGNDPTGRCCDRTVFEWLKNKYTGVCTQKATAFYRMDPNDVLHKQRMTAIEQKRKKAQGQIRT